METQIINMYGDYYKVQLKTKTVRTFTDGFYEPNEYKVMIDIHSVYLIDEEGEVIKDIYDMDIISDVYEHLVELFNP